MRRALLAAESGRAGGGGIARVARLAAMALRDEGIPARALLLNGLAGDLDGILPATACGGSRLRFAAGCHLAAWSGERLLFDFVGMARAAPRWPTAPYLTFLCGIEVWHPTRPDRIARARAARCAVAISRYTLARAQADFGPLPSAEVCWLATPEDDAAPPRPQPGPPTALVLGRIEADGGYKGHRELIASWPAVLRGVPGARLRIVGGGPGLQRIRALANASPAAAAITVEGFVEESRIERIWAEATCLAMPSRGEGFGLVYIEAMRRGIPVVASVHDAGQEVNLDGVSGLNVDLDRDGGLADALTSILGDPAHARRLGSGGQERWRDHFRYAAFRARFAPILRRFLDS